MARGASQGTLAFWNGYGEFPTREHVWVTVVPYAGELYPVTPPFYAGIAWPFYRAFGFPGLFWMNALAFLVVLWLTARFAQQLFGDARLSLTAALVHLHNFPFKDVDFSNCWGILGGYERAQAQTPLVSV